jgi:tryptophan synthase beta subunit
MEAVRLERLAVETLRQQLMNEHVTNIALVGSERHQIQQDIAAMKKQRDEALQDWSHVLRSKPIKYICICLAKRWGPHPAGPGNMRSTIAIVRRVSFSTAVTDRWHVICSLY